MAGEADSRCYRNKDFFEVANLNKKHFGVVGRSLGVPWFVFGSSLVFNPRGIGKVQGKGNLNNCALLSLTSLPPWVGEEPGNIVGIVAIETSG